MSLPHRFPFRLVDRRAGEVVILAWTVGAYWWTDRALPAAWLAEAMAQAAALLLGEPPRPGDRLSLAGLEGVECTRPPVAGERLEIEARLTARLGAVVKVEAVVRAGGEEIARGALLLGSS